MQTTNPTISTKLSVDCCTATGITCDSTPRVKEIRWANIGLDGSIDSSLLPSFTLLTFLELSGNKLTGAIPIALPPGLIFLDLNSNEFTGTVPNAWPHTLTTIQLGANGLSGTIPSSGWPPGLQRLLMYSNALTGVIPSGFPNYLTELNLGNNQLTGSIPSLPQGLKNLHIDANRLSGTLPSNFPKLLTELHIHDNAGLTGNVTSIITMSMLSLRLGYPGTTGTSFTGTIRVNKPTQLFLNGNLITDVAISDPSLLSNVTCDISNNPLLGSSSLSYLGVCVRNGLYKITMSTAKSTIVPTSTTHFKLTLSTTQLAEDTTLSTTFTKSTFLVATTDLFSQSSDSFQTQLLDTLSFDNFPFNTVTISTKLESQIPEATFVEMVNVMWIYIAIGGFIVLCLLVVIGGRCMKNTNIKSKFGRKNSFGTLNTAAPSVRTRNKEDFLF